MNNQKKIEDILYSIQELILEARNEEKLERLDIQKIINLNTIEQPATQNLEKNTGRNTYLDKNQKASQIKFKNLENNSTKNNSSLKNSWKNLSFKKCQEKPQKLSLEKIKEENLEIEKVFKESLDFWIKKNLPELIKEETAMYTKKILEQKLK